MTLSIQQIFQNGYERMEAAQDEFYKDPSRLAEFCMSLQETMLQIGRDYLRTTFEEADEILRESPVRRGKGWQVVRKDPRAILTCLGEVRFTRTLFLNTRTKKNAYLADRILHLEPHAYLMEDAQARLLEEAVQTSYRRGGEAASLREGVSKQTVKKLLHSLSFQSEKESVGPENRKTVEYLFIDADEDHVSLQFRDHKGDLEVTERGYKNNTEISKLVYVYEGIEPEKEGSRRHRLIAPHYFSGTYRGEKNKVLWEEVWSYISKTYDTDHIRRIYLNGDGGGWIKGANAHLGGLVYVLDEFHMQKYLNKMVGHMEDSTEDAKEELLNHLMKNERKGFRECAERIRSCAETDAAAERVSKSAAYILNNWTAARVRLISRDIVKGCSAEGHVSHVLSSRMSSRPMGWSSLGTDQMSHLRAYHYNHGDMLKLVRSQNREPVGKAVGAEYEILSCQQILDQERRLNKRNGKYIDTIQATVSAETRKQAWFRSQIWGL